MEHLYLAYAVARRPSRVLAASALPDAPTVPDRRQAAASRRARRLLAVQFARRTGPVRQWQQRTARI